MATSMNVEYAIKHDTIHLLESMCTALLVEKPSDPIPFLQHWLSTLQEDIPPISSATSTTVAQPPSDVAVVSAPLSDDIPK
mmetsp:Transcript_58423/g.67482  ORF Transcript_58423/g.67482 Transcript_58423/m.67482 type:complete len:81 (+) Transcript_58423:102-344(+)